MSDITVTDDITRRLIVLEGNQYKMATAHEELKLAVATVASDTADLVSFIQGMKSYFSRSKRFVLWLVVFISGLGAACAGLTGIYNLFHILTTHGH